MKISKVQEAISGLNRSWGWLCLFVAAFLLTVAGEATVGTVQGAEEDDIKALRQLENDIAQAWVQRDTQTLDRILADDFTFAGAGNGFSVRCRSTRRTALSRNRPCLSETCPTVSTEWNSRSCLTGFFSRNLILGGPRQKRQHLRDLCSAQGSSGDSGERLFVAK